jgi:L-lactate dehydrogenase complex protein LldE
MNDSASDLQPAPPRVGLFVTCLVDLMRPSVGFAAVELLEKAGCVVEVPPTQTCCGQPAYNSGDKATAAELARQTIAAFEGFDYVVAPSGSCAGMLKRHYPQLLADDPTWLQRSRALAAKVHELVSFLVRIRGITKVDARFPAIATYHHSCSGLRELGIAAEPLQLLRTVEGLELKELPDSNACCGFGGSFAVKYPTVSNAIVEAKTAAIAGTGADLVIAGDLGCLMNMAGKLRREGRKVAARHVAEVLVGASGTAPIGGEP